VLALFLIRISDEKIIHYLLVSISKKQYPFSYFPDKLEWTIFMLIMTIAGVVDVSQSKSEYYD
jgi:hypothetical protein